MLRFLQLGEENLKGLLRFNIIVTDKNPLANLVINSMVKFWLMAAAISKSPEQKKPQARICRRPSVSDRKPHTSADDIMPRQ